MHYQTQYYRVQLTILLGDGLIEAAMGQCSQTRIWQNTIRDDGYILIESVDFVIEPVLTINFCGNETTERDIDGESRENSQGREEEERINSVKQEICSRRSIQEYRGSAIHLRKAWFKSSSRILLVSRYQRRSRLPLASCMCLNTLADDVLFIQNIRFIFTSIWFHPLSTGLTLSLAIEEETNLPPKYNSKKKT
ncbi:hypothetical protein YC2023_048463 [Brassica napus]